MYARSDVSQRASMTKVPFVSVHACILIEGVPWNWHEACAALVHTWQDDHLAGTLVCSCASTRVAVYTYIVLHHAYVVLQSCICDLLCVSSG